MTSRTHQGGGKPGRLSCVNPFLLMSRILAGNPGALTRSRGQPRRKRVAEGSGGSLRRPLGIRQGRVQCICKSSTPSHGQKVSRILPRDAGKAGAGVHLQLHSRAAENRLQFGVVVIGQRRGRIAARAGTLPTKGSRVHARYQGDLKVVDMYE